MGSMAERAHITITGVVQGVGFRPYVYGLAVGLGIRGHVTNTAAGVVIEAEGDRLREFLDRLPKEAPPLSRIADINVRPLPVDNLSAFTILPSTDTAKAFTLLSPDVSICPDCRRELLDPRDRRYLYPFINCTNCGPRYSLTLRVPYDRPNTTMASFLLCPDCEREYLDPANRRFHAQPNACPKCGPHIQFNVLSSQFSVEGIAALDECTGMLKSGGVVAIKGLGGFHIACDASNDNAVKTLRERKRKSNKPFAVMASSVEEIRKFCHVNEQEQTVLESHQRPIALLRKKKDCGSALPEVVSPNNDYLGCMLPYTPLHYLLFHQDRGNAAASPNFRALVMTSGNLSEEPIVRDNAEAQQKLSGIVDAFLQHNRDIFMRVDDSVLSVQSSPFMVQRPDMNGPSAPEPGTMNCGLSFYRRSRGYAPEPIRLASDGPEVLGCGADLKNTFTLTKGAYAIPSQHIGDMENYETMRFYEETLENLKQVYRVDPIAIAHDLHPGYMSTQWAKGRPDIQIFGIQHHYAHIGSVMAEQGLAGPVIGIAFDGTGYGTDGNLWGGEFLVADIDGFERMGQLKYLPLPGGEAAIREPWRTAVSLVRLYFGADAFEILDRIGLTTRQGGQQVRQVLQVASSPDLSPLASGAGRYFDALASLIGICDRNTFEGEAAMALESLVTLGEDRVYPVDYIEQNGYITVDLGPLVRSVIGDLTKGQNKRSIATMFHNTFAAIIRSMAERVSGLRGIKDIALSGGTFQNRYLIEKASKLLRESGFPVFTNRKMPPNDACISLGQAYIVRERLKRSGEPGK